MLFLLARRGEWGEWLAKQTENEQLRPTEYMKGKI